MLLTSELFRKLSHAIELEKGGNQTSRGDLGYGEGMKPNLEQEVKQMVTGHHFFPQGLQCCSFDWFHSVVHLVNIVMLEPK